MGEEVVSTISKSVEWSDWQTWKHIHIQDSNFADLEPSWAPVDKLNSPLGLDGGNGSVHILGYHVSTIQQTARHVLTMTRIAFYHLIGRLKASIGDLRNTELFMVGFFSRDDRRIRGQREVNSRVRHKVGLEMVAYKFRGLSMQRFLSHGRETKVSCFLI